MADDASPYLPSASRSPDRTSAERVKEPVETQKTRPPRRRAGGAAFNAPDPKVGRVCFRKPPAATGLQIRSHESETRCIGNFLQIRAVEKMPVIRLLNTVGSGAPRQQPEKSRADIDADGGKADQGICDFLDQVDCPATLEAERGPCIRQFS